MVTAGSRVPSKVTFNELLDTLRLLEEEPELLPPPKLLKKDRHAWIDGVSGGMELVGSDSRFLHELPSPSACWVVEGGNCGWFMAREDTRPGAAGAWASSRRIKTMRGQWWEWG